MSDFRTVLERVERRVGMPEPAMERLLRRRERRRRNERIASATVGLLVAAIGMGGSLLALGVGGTSKPASGATPLPDAPGGVGWVSTVLPTIAIWMGLAVLGVTALAIVRVRRAKPGSTAGRERTSAESTPGHGPVGDADTVRQEGRSEMDSRTKSDTSLREIGIAETRLGVPTVERVNRWLVSAVVLLAVALVVVGTWAIVDRSGEEAPTVQTPTQIGVADPATVQTLDALSAAATGEKFASFFTEDGVLVVRTDESETIEGRAAIASAMQGSFDAGWYTDRLGSVAQWGNFAAHAIAGPTEVSPHGKRDFHGMVIYEFGPDGKISHMWAFGDYRR